MRKNWEKFEIHISQKKIEKNIYKIKACFFFIYSVLNIKK